MTVGLESSTSAADKIGFIENKEWLYVNCKSSDKYFFAKVDMYGHALNGFAIQSLQFPN